MVIKVEERAKIIKNWILYAQAIGDVFAQKYFPNIINNSICLEYLINQKIKSLPN